MSDLLWPGDERCGDLFGDAAVLAAMVRVEAAWLGALTVDGVAEAAAHDDLAGLVGDDDVPAVAAGAEAGGNPVIPLLALLRERLKVRNPLAASWLHRGLTSQDVLDTALALCLRDAAARIRADLATQTAALSRLAAEHRGTPMAGCTLTQHAVPITFGLKAAGWLTGVLDARDRLATADPPAQFGGAAGSLAAPVALAGSPAAARDLVEGAAATLGLAVRDPWHTARWSGRGAPGRSPPAPSSAGSRPGSPGANRWSPASCSTRCAPSTRRAMRGPARRWPPSTYAVGSPRSAYPCWPWPGQPTSRRRPTAWP